MLVGEGTHSSHEDIDYTQGRDECMCMHTSLEEQSLRAWFTKIEGWPLLAPNILYHLPPSAPSQSPIHKAHIANNMMAQACPLFYQMWAICTRQIALDSNCPSCKIKIWPTASNNEHGWGTEALQNCKNDILAHLDGISQSVIVVFNARYRL